MIDTFYTKDNPFQLPDFWNDDALMKPLSALSQSESHNPNNWVGLHEFWEKMILEWATSNRKLMFNEENLKKAFGRKGKYPASLNKVLDKMEKDGSIVTKDNCCHQTTVYSSPFGWFLNSLGKPIVMLVSLIWKSVMSYIFKERAVTLKTFVVPSVLEMKCERFLQLPLNELRDLHSNMHAYNSETQLVLFHLEKMGKLNVKASSDQPIVPAMKAKRLPQSNTELSISPAEQKEKKFYISQIDGRLIDLKQTEKLLKDEISNMESKIISLEVTARRRLNGASRESAKNTLFRRKQQQLICDQRKQFLIKVSKQIQDMEAYKIHFSSLINLSGDPLINEENIQDTESKEELKQQSELPNMLLQNTVHEDEYDSYLEEVVKDYTIDLSVFNTSSSDPSMNQENVEESVPDVKTELKQQRQIASILSQNYFQEDEFELEEELNKILAESDP